MVLDFGASKWRALFMMGVLLLFGRMASAQCTGTITSSGATTICTGATGPTITVATPTTGVSYQLKRGTTNVGTAKNGTTGTALNWTNNNTAGTYTVVATKSTAPTCTATLTGSVIVTVNALPTAPTVTSGNRCGSGTVALSASSATAGTFKWYSALTSGILLQTSASSVTSNTYTTASISATTTYYVTFTNANNCESSPRTAVVATVYTAPTVTNGARCATGTVALSAGNAVAGTFKWYSALTSGILLQTSAPGVTSNTYTTASISVTTTYYVTVGNGTCESSPRTAVVATIRPLPTAPTITAGNRCGSGAVPLSASSATAGTFKWYDAATNGNLLQTSAPGISSNTYTTASISATTTYYVTFTNTNNCESSPRTSVTAIINPLPAAPTLSLVGSGQLSQQSIAMSSTISGINYTLYLNGQTTGRTTAGNGQPYTWTALAADGTYYVVATNAQTCTSQSNSINVVNGLVSDQVEFNALKDLFISTNGANWTNKTNWPTTWPASATSAQFGTWFGVEVGGGDVVRLLLASNNLVGILPGTLPTLKSLDGIYMENNSLSGSLPAFSGSNVPLIKYLSFYNNQLTGPIPTSLNTLSNLTSLNIYANQFTGSIPDLSFISGSLTDLRIGSGLLSAAPMPAWIGSMTNLNTLTLYGANLNGQIPSWIGNLTKLQNLNLGYNSLTGALPIEMSNCKELLQFSAVGNQLDNLSNDLRGLTKLSYLELSSNKFTGALPNWVGQLPALQYLILTSNKFAGNLPASISSMPNLLVMYLNDNQFTGSLPDAANLPNLQWFSAAHNQFSGPVPSSYTQRSFSGFDVGYNRLTGTFPNISGWIYIGSLSLTANDFSGAFPDVTGLSSLTYIEATNNKFTSIPVSVFNLPSSYYVSFQNNEINVITGLTSSNALFPSQPGFYLDQNRLDFSQLQLLLGRNPNLWGNAMPQKNIQDITSTTFVEGNALTVPARPVGTNTTTTWYKKVSGVWQDVTASNQGTSPAYGRTTATLSDEGTYYWKMTDTQFPNQTLQSGPIVVKTQTRQSIDTWAFQYKYDGRKRMTHKKVPGAEWVYMVYDQRDRLVMTQDGEQRKLNNWLFTKYDALNRLVLTGIYTTGTTAVDQPTMQGNVDAYYNQTVSTSWAWHETFSTTGAVHGYDNKSFPLVSDPNQYLTVTYYDNYDFKTLYGSRYNYASDGLSGTSNGGVSYTQPASEFGRVVGQVTGIKVKMLLGTYMGGWLKSVTYYDDKYRTLQTISDNNVNGIDRSSNLYDFVGKVIKSKTSHNSSFLDWKDGAYVELTPTSVSSTGSESGPYVRSGVKLMANTDGWIEFSANPIASGCCAKTIGLRKTGGADIDYSLSLSQWTCYVMEKSTLMPNTGFGGVSGEDVFRISRAGSTVTYSWKGSVFYTSTVPSTEELELVIVENGVGLGTHDIKASFGRQTSLSTTRTFEYDHAGRLLKTWHSINGATPVLLAQNEYNELGQLVDKKLYSADNGTNFKQSVDYRYNIRGWLTSINGSQLTINGDNDDTNDLFGMNLHYNDVVAGLTTAPDLQFNGNISSIQYSNNLGLGSIKERGYKFGYDPMNRLLNATHKEKTTGWNATTAYHEDNLQYDLNGNILNLNRKGAGGANMDMLNYIYQGNQLLTVSDAGDVQKGFVDGNIGSTDYVYDANGNMTVDNNKAIASITYNHLNLPEKVTKTNGDYIRYVYDATGRKLNQSVYIYNAQLGAQLKKSTDYAGEFFYENDTLRFINHEEGRVTKDKTTGALTYEYNLKDHLGNVRLTFTTKVDVDDSKATMEIANASVERSKFLKYDDARFVNSSLFDHTNGTRPTTTLGYAVRLSGSANEKIGLTRSLSVMPGDVIDMEAFGKYYDPSAAHTDQAAWNNLVALIGNAAAGAASVVVDGAGYVNSANRTLPFTSPLNYGSDNVTFPKAHLNWLIFDRDFVFKDGGFKQLQGGQEDGTDKDFYQLAQQLTIKEPGYMYIWLSNDNATPIEVYFDDFKITQHKSAIIASDDYYPGGATFNSWTRENSVPNSIKFQETEWQDELGLNLYDFDARMYDPFILRTPTHDPHAEDYPEMSPYSFLDNNPINTIDPGGMDAIGLNEDYLFDQTRLEPGSTTNAPVHAICETCPKDDPRFKPFIDDPNHNYIYDPTSGQVSTLLDEVTVTGSSPFSVLPDEPMHEPFGNLEYFWGGGIEGGIKYDKSGIPMYHVTAGEAPDIGIGKAAKTTMVLVKQGEKLVAKKAKEVPKLWRKLQKQLARPKTTATVGKASTYGEVAETATGVPHSIGPESRWQKLKRVIAILGQSF